MTDQASQLRHLVLRAARQRETEVLPPPRTAAVAGATRGLGVTTVTARLGQALAEQGSRIVLIDADAQRTDLAKVCSMEIPEGFDPAVVRRDIHEALFPAPGGLQVVPGVWTDSPPTTKSLQQILRQFHQLGRHADLLLLDLGTPGQEVLQGWSENLNEVLVVSTPSGPSVMDAYGLIKRSFADCQGAGVRLVVNRARGEQEALDVFQRVNRSCRRFLGFEIEFAGYIAAGNPGDAYFAQIAARLGQPRKEREAQRRHAA